MSQVVRKPHSNHVVSNAWRDDADQFSLEGTHLDPLAIGPCLGIARIGLSRPCGRRPSHPASNRGSTPLKSTFISAGIRRSRLASAWSAPDRKSTRLNSSHLGISY